MIQSDMELFIHVCVNIKKKKAKTDGPELCVFLQNLKKSLAMFLLRNQCCHEKMDLFLALLIFQYSPGLVLH